jgi:neutral amino acid transport system permease protein
MDILAVLGDALRSSIGPQAAAFALVAMGLNLQFGYAGLLNFGQVGFMLIGGYGVALSVTSFGLPLWVGVLVGLAGAIVLGLLLGIPTLRLRGDYLAIATLGAAEILRLTFRSAGAEPLTNGVLGVQQYARGFYAANPFGSGELSLLGLSMTGTQVWIALVGWLLVAIFFVVTFVLIRSPWGRILRAIRDDEEATRALGKNVYSYKMQALVFGGCLAALGGMVLTVSSQSITPDAFSSELSFFAFAALLLGGRGTLGGPILGAMLFWFLASGADSLLRQAVSAGGLDGVFAGGLNSGAVRFILVGLALVLFMLFRANGILGAKQRRAVGSEQV